MISVLWFVVFIVCIKLVLFQVLIFFLCVIYCVWGVFVWIFGISGLFGFCGMDVVVMIGILYKVVILVSVVVCVCNFGIGMLLMV